MIVKTRSQCKSPCIVVQNPCAISGATRASHGLNVTQNSTILMGHCQFTSNILVLQIVRIHAFIYCTQTISTVVIVIQI